MGVRNLIIAGVLLATGAVAAPAAAGPYLSVGERAQARQDLRLERRATRQQYRQGLRQDRRGVVVAPGLVPRGPSLTRRAIRKSERRALRRAERRALRRAERRFERRAVGRAVGRAVWYRGDVLPRARYNIVDHGAYYLPRPGRGFRYMQVGNDLLLVALATGVIVDVLR